MNRRNFLKAAGVGAGAALAAGAARGAFAQDEAPAAPYNGPKVRVGCIGTGGQGCFHLSTGLARAQNIEVVAVCDVYQLHLDGGWELAGGKTRTVNKYMNYKEMLDKEQLDAVIIATPLATHAAITLDCLDAGKYVFCQKTLAFTIEDCRKIVEKCHETGKFCQVGHQRRYDPMYNKAMWLQREKGLMGRINHMTCQWHRNQPWRRVVDETQVLSPEEQVYIKDIERHLNWRMYKETSGGLMTELATHQVDIMNWFMGTPPSRVFASGSLDYWRDNREIEDNVAVVYEYDLKPDNPAFAAILPRTPFVDRKKMNRPYKVRGVFTSTTATAKRGSSELYQGDQASVELTEDHGLTIFAEPDYIADIKAMEDYERQLSGAPDAAEAAKKVTSGTSRKVPVDALTKGYKVALFNDKPTDQIQFESFANDIINKGMPKANQMVGLMTAIAGLKGLESLVAGGTVVEIDPALYAFNFETPDPYRYDNWAGPDTPGAAPANQQTSAPGTSAPAEAPPAAREAAKV